MVYKALNKITVRPYFEEKIFRNRAQSMKFTKNFLLENNLLYGSISVNKLICCGCFVMQDRTIPAPSACVVAVQTLFGNEECSVIARQLMAGSDILTNNIPNPTCIANLLEYAASCNVSLDNVSYLY